MSGTESLWDETTRMGDSDGGDQDPWSLANLLDGIESLLWLMGEDTVEVPAILEDGPTTHVPRAYIDPGDIDVLGCIFLPQLREALRAAGLNVPLHGAWEELAEEADVRREEQEATEAEAAVQATENLAPVPSAGVPGTVAAESEAQRETVLYRWYDESDLLLYIGISDSLGSRTRGHAMGSSWMDFAVRSTVERHPSRADALAAERAAIKVEQPLFNDVHNRTPETQQRLVDYLIKHGRLDLLAPAVSRG